MQETESTVDFLREKLTPIDYAVYQFLLNLRRFELGEVDPRELLPGLSDKYPVKIDIGWSSGRSTQYHIENTQNSQFPSLVRLQLGDPEEFRLLLKPEIDRDEYDRLLQTEGWEKLERQFPTFGAGNIRIFGKPRDTEILITANIGQFAGTEKLWEWLVRGIDFPIVVTDRDGFEFRK